MTRFPPWEGVSAIVLDLFRPQFRPVGPLRPCWTTNWTRFTLALAFGVGSGLLAGCAGSNGSADGPDGAPAVTARYTLVTHESCNISDEHAVREDVNGDGKPDVITVSEGGTKVCQWLDFNFDGVCDSWVYFTPNGQVRRREVDYDRDGRIDETTDFRGGKIVERERATTLVGKIDTWQHFDHGRLSRAERDTNGDGIVDQWWEYRKQAAAKCPLIHSDMDGDGRPDPGATVDLCAKDEDKAERDEGFDEFDAPLSETVEDGATKEPTAGAGGAKAQTVPAPRGKVTEGTK